MNNMKMFLSTQWKVALESFSEYQQTGGRVYYYAVTKSTFLKNIDLEKVKAQGRLDNYKLYWISWIDLLIFLHVFWELFGYQQTER